MEEQKLRERVDYFVMRVLKEVPANKLIEFSFYAKNLGFFPASEDFPKVDIEEQFKPKWEKSLDDIKKIIVDNIMEK